MDDNDYDVDNAGDPGSTLKQAIPLPGWAFKFGCWRPTAFEWMSMIAAVQNEEKDRINRFVFQRDAKAALVGRLLIRKAVSHLTGLQYHDIHLGRTEKGKPYLKNGLPDGLQFDFNISHDGDYAVLAAETYHAVGIDTVQLDRMRSKTTDEFLELMSRQLTKPEWDRVYCTTEEQVKLATFYRHWCLKESYVKLLGIGVGLSLDRLTCQISTSLTNTSMVSDTRMMIDGQLDTDTFFEELILDDTYAVSVALKRTSPAESFVERTPVVPFTMLSVADLLDGVETQISSNPSVSDDWTAFCGKPETPQPLNSRRN